MSRLYLNDLESIKNGRMQRYSLYGDMKSISLVSLSKIDYEREEFQRIRNFIIKMFQEDTKEEFDRLYNSKIHTEEKVDLNHEKLFLDDYLSVTIPTILGDSHCLLDENGMVSSTGFGSDLEKKVKLIMPYVKRLFELKKQSHVLDNEFYSKLDILNTGLDKVLYLYGGGILLPFNDYKELSSEELQKLLVYYYQNYNEILKNILVPNGESLNKYRLDINKEKALSIYKGL